jgi:hypothetical protein
LNRITTEIESTDQGIAWVVTTGAGELGRGVAFDAEAALAAGDELIDRYKATCSAFLKSLQEFSGEEICEELVIKVRGRMRALCSIFDELS